jgi:hypothetical protein
MAQRYATVPNSVKSRGFGPNHGMARGIPGNHDPPPLLFLEAVVFSVYCNSEAVVSLLEVRHKFTSDAILLVEGKGGTCLFHCIFTRHSNQPFFLAFIGRRSKGDTGSECMSVLGMTIWVWVPDIR